MIISIEISLFLLIAPLRDEEDELLQLAIQQSLLEYSNVNPDEQGVINSAQPDEDDDEMLQRLAFLFRCLCLISFFSLELRPKFSIAHFVFDIISKQIFILGVAVQTV